jgi:hypothetical protein
LVSLASALRLPRLGWGGWSWWLSAQTRTSQEQSQMVSWLRVLQRM